MAEVTVKQFADVLGIEVDKLLTQLTEAGLAKDGAEAGISDDEKMRLLNHLRRSHGKDDETASAEPKKITLKRRSVSELKLAGGQGRSKTVSVEVRKKRTYVKRSVVLEEEAQRKAEEQARRDEQEAKMRAERESLEAERKAAEERERLNKPFKA